MPTLKIDDEEIRVSRALVIRVAERMWKLGSDPRRAAFTERARARLQAGHRGKNDVAAVILADHVRG